MTQEQFFQLMRNPHSRIDVSTKELAQLVEQFPYSQPLRFIYLQQLKEQNSIHFNQQLKLTSIYSPDRSKLYNYINETNRDEFRIQNSEFRMEEEEVKLESRVVFESVEIEEQRTEPEITPPVSVDEEEFFREEIANEVSVDAEMQVVRKEDEKMEDEKMEEKDLSLQDIINQRLRELNIEQKEDAYIPVLPEVEKEEEEIEVSENSSETPTLKGATSETQLSDNVPFSAEVEENSDQEIISDQQVEVHLDEIELHHVVSEDEEEREIILENEQTPEVLETSQVSESLIDELILENLAESQFYKNEMLLNESEEPAPYNVQPKKKAEPDLEIPPPEDAYLQNLDADLNKPHSFLDWLKISKQKKVFTPTEKKSEQKRIAEPTPTAEKKDTHKDELIEKFIKEDPRITPARSTFYSPVNMARESVKENEDLVSETLAKIYATQGNLEKAIASYQKLLLKYPEKKTYFAALIENLKAKINS